MIRTVSTHTNPIEAHITRCRLEYEGIPAFVATEHHIWAMWSRSVALGGVKVQVPSSYYDSAQEIVANIIAGEYESELYESDQSPSVCVCPKCELENLKAVNWPWKLALVVVFMLVIPLPYTMHMKRCNQCSYIWIAHEQRGVPIYVIFITLLVITASLFAMSEMWCHWCRLHCENPYVCLP
jgi:hypothetical protein